MTHISTFILSTDPPPPSFPEEMELGWGGFGPAPSYTENLNDRESVQYHKLSLKMAAQRQAGSHWASPSETHELPCDRTESRLSQEPWCSGGSERHCCCCFLSFSYTSDFQLFLLFSWSGFLLISQPPTPAAPSRPLRSPCLLFFLSLARSERERERMESMTGSFPN